MNTPISAKELRASLPRVVEKLRRGARFTVLYRNRPAFRIVAVGDDGEAAGPLDADPLYQ